MGIKVETPNNSELGQAEKLHFHLNCFIIKLVLNHWFIYDGNKEYHQFSQI